MATQNDTRLQPFGQGLWVLPGDTISFFSFPYELRMAIVKLGDGSLLLHSPVQLTGPRHTLVQSLGPVAAIVTPNKLHHLFLGAWASAFPDAGLYAPPGLARKRPDLRFTSELTNNPEPVWGQDLRQRVIRGSVFMDEVLFFHIASSTLIIGDLIENHCPRLLSRLQRQIARLNRMLGPFGETPRNYRVSFMNRRLARADIRHVLSWNPQQVLVMHGCCVTTEAGAFLNRAFSWLLRG